jgi:hypothetical protein
VQAVHLPVAHRAGTGVLEVRELSDDLAGIEGSVIIEWPAGTPSGITPGCLVSIYDAVTGDQIMTATHADVVVHAGIPRCITADLTLFIDEAGNPIFNADTWPSGAYMNADGEMAADVFTFLVTGMRVRQ